MAGKGQRGQLRSPAYLCSGCRVSSWGTPQDTGDFRGKSDMVTVFEKGHSGAVKDGWEEEAPSAVHTVHYDQTSQGRYFTLCFHLEWKLRFLSCIFFPTENCMLQFFSLYIIFCLVYKGNSNSSRWTMSYHTCNERIFVPDSSTSTYVAIALNICNL